MRKLVINFLCFSLILMCFNRVTFAGEPNIGNGKSFDGTEQINFTNLSVNTAAGAKNTVEFWMYWNGINGQMPFSWSTGYDLYFSSNYFGFNTSEGNVLGISANELKGTWVHVTAIFSNGVPDSTNNELYINGIKQNISQVVKTTTRSKTVSSTGYISGYGDKYKFNGKLAHLRIWNRALSSEEIQASMQKNFLSGDEVGLVGSWDLTEEPQASKNFDGTKQIQLTGLKVNVASGAKNTVQFWMYWDGTEKVMPFSWSGGYDLYFVGNAFGFNTGESNVYGISSVDLKNKWVNVAAVFYNGVPDSFNAELYINGLKQTLSPLVGTTTASKSAKPQAYISGYGEKYKFKGKLANLQIWDRGLSQSEIQSNMYRSVFTNIETGLVGSWKLLEEPQVYKSFDGVTQFELTDIPVNTLQGAKNTVEFWMYWDGTNGQMPFSWATGYNLYFTSGYFGFNTLEGNVLGISASELKGTWVHVAAVFYNGVPDSTNNELYLNGVKQEISQVVKTTTLNRAVSSSAYVSGRGDKYKLNGKISQVRIWNKALTENEIQSNMYRTLSVEQTDGLIGVWNIEDDLINSNSGTVQYVYDSAGRINYITYLLD
ncbi:LamG domain-containing protein [Paenibacillus sp. M1]|uniref:LamG domain-containing protein n=1 Tax=Paenibacillus haidiansis TaxID=1574488 RepID=A0ABU7VUU7_9BACL